MYYTPQCKQLTQCICLQIPYRQNHQDEMHNISNLLQGSSRGNWCTSPDEYLHLPVWIHSKLPCIHKNAVKRNYQRYASAISCLIEAV